MTKPRLKIIGTIVLLLLIITLTLAVTVYAAWSLASMVAFQPTATSFPMPTHTPTQTASPTHTATATSLPAPAQTPTPKATAVPSSTPTVSPSALPTKTPLPTDTSIPAPSNTPTLTPTRARAATATALRPTPTPTVASTYPAPVLLEPVADQTLTSRQRFTWQWEGPRLGDNLAFDLRIWSEREEREARARRGAIAPTRETGAEVDLQFVPAIQDYGPGNYYWTVVLVEVRPDAPPKVVGHWGETRRFTFSGATTPAAPGPPTSPPEPTPKPPQPTPTRIQPVFAKAKQATLPLVESPPADAGQEDCYEPGNLAPNPSFECTGSSPTEPADWEYETYKGKPAIFYHSQLTAKSGIYSAAIASGSTSSQSRWQSIPIAARAGRIYEFATWVNADNLSNIATVALTFWSEWPSPNTLLREVRHPTGTGNTSGDWVHLVQSYMAPTDTQYIRLELHLLGAGTAYFDDVSIHERVVEPVLNLAQVDSPDPVPPGGVLRYTVTYSNTGNITATHLLITDTFDAHVLFDTASPPPSGGSDQTRYWEFSDVPVDGPHHIVITTNVESLLPDYTLLHNLVEWRSDQTGLSQNLEETLVHSYPVLSITKTDAVDPVNAGDWLTYSIAYTNSGTAAMTDILLLESYPPDTPFVAASPPPSNPPENTLWLMPDLAPGESQAVTVVLSTSASTPGHVLNTVLFDSNQTSPVWVTETTVISGTHPPYVMRFSPERTTVWVEVGQASTHPFYLGNTSSVTLADLTLSASRPERWKGEIRVDPASIASLSPGEWYPVSLIVEPATDEISGAYTTQLAATSAEAVAYASGTILVARNPAVQIEPDYKMPARPGDRVLFRHQITNLGNFTDTILVDVQPSVPWPVSPTSFSLLDVGIEEMRPFTLVVTVPHEALPPFENQVVVSATSSGGPPSEHAYDVIVVRPWEVYLPTVLRQITQADPFCNGDFADELQPCWTYTQDPPVARICAAGNCLARLGTAEDDALCVGQLSPGTATLVQTFTPATSGTPTLSFEYEVHTQDVLSSLYDTLEVYVDGKQVFQLNKANLNYGCDRPPMVVSDRLEIPVPLTQGQPITIEFHLRNSDTWFNTYADIRDIRLTD